MYMYLCDKCCCCVYVCMYYAYTLHIHFLSYTMYILCMICICNHLNLPGLGLVQKVVYSGEGAGTGADAGHKLNTLFGLAQSQHQGRLLRQVLGLCGQKNFCKVLFLCPKVIQRGSVCLCPKIGRTNQLYVCVCMCVLPRIALLSAEQRFSLCMGSSC